MIESIGIVGGGAWGTALALTAARAGRTVRIWARDRATVARHRRAPREPALLARRRSRPDIPATDSLGIALRADAIVLAVPAQAVRAVAAAAAPYIPPARRWSSRQGPRTRHRHAPHASRRRGRAAGGPCRAVRPRLRRRRGAGHADRRHHRRAHDEALALALCHAFASSAFRPYAETDVDRRRDRRRGQERARHRRRHRAGARPRRQCARRADRPRLRRTPPPRRGARRPARHADGPLRPRRPRAHLLRPAVAQLRLRPRSRPRRRPGRAPSRSSRASPPPPVARDLARKHEVSTPIVDAVAAIIDGTLAIDAAIEGLMSRPLKREAD